METNLIQIRGNGDGTWDVLDGAKVVKVCVMPTTALYVAAGMLGFTASFTRSPRVQTFMPSEQALIAERNADGRHPIG